VRYESVGPYVGDTRLNLVHQKCTLEVLSGAPWCRQEQSEWWNLEDEKLS